MSHIKISHPSQEGILKVSKWLKHQVLLDIDEIEQLFSHLSSFELYNTSEVVDKAFVPRNHFLEMYARYINALKSGKVLEDKEIRGAFSLVLSTLSSVFYQMEVRPGKYLVKALKPIVQMQMHQFLPSRLDKKIHPMVLSQDSVAWGLQFSYPQICQDPQTNLFSKVNDSEQFPNTHLFTRLVKWLRNFSVPVTFVWAGEKKPTSLRLGKKCFCWINTHPQLKKNGMEIYVH